MDDEPVVVYSGHRMESMFLVTLLEGSGIPAQMSDRTLGEASLWVYVFVAQRDVERALPLVEDFKKNGTKSTD